MAQINLLPVIARQRHKKIELNIRLKPIIFSFIALMLALMVSWAMLGIGLTAEQKKLARLDGELNSLKSILQRLNKLKKDKEMSWRKLGFMNQELKRETLWAENLNRLSNLIPPGIWLKSIVLHTKKEDHLNKYVKLDIDGLAISLYGEEMIDLIGGFMTALKKDEVFSEQISEIKLISSQRSRESGKTEIMDFKLSCQFR